MSYTITHSNGTNPIVIADGTVDTTTSITLVGRNTPSYGQYLDQNFLNMLENFSNVSQPVNPISGQLWYNSATGLLKVYTGSVFKNVSSATSGVSQPTNPSTGDFWWDTTNQQLNVYSGSSWKVIGPTSVGTVVAETITDTSSINHNVISFEIGGVRYAILSKDQAFIPQAPGILGYSRIAPGINIANTSFVNNNRFVGTATNSDSLGGVYATSFMRSDQNTATTGILSVTNDGGINLGSSGVGTIKIESGNEVHFDNNLNNGIIKLRTYINGTVADALDILGNADVRVNGNLFVLGNVGIGGQLNVGGAQNTFSGNVSVGSLAITSGNLSVNALNAAIIGNSGAILIGTISTASQPNITSLGNLSSLQVNGVANFANGTVTFNPTASNKLNLGNVGNVNISGGSTGQYLATDGSGNLSWNTITIPTITIPPSNVGGGSAANQVAVYANAGSIIGSSGLTYGSSTLSVTGAVIATGDITAFYSSDINLKTNISNISNALEKVKQINGVTYNWNDTAKSIDRNKTDDVEAGVIAQEVQKVLPQIVTQRDDGYLAVRYEKLVPLLIEAIKELAAEVELLKKRG